MIIENYLKNLKKIFKISFISFFVVATLFSCKSQTLVSSNNNKTVGADTIHPSDDDTIVADTICPSNNDIIDENGSYTSKDEVALYIYTYKKLPKNFITKSEAKKLGWNSSKNYVGDVAKGKSIGGDRFNNYQKILPDIKGRKYIECDIDYKGKKRNAKRIVYADDFDEKIGCIYYTEDHYNTFEKLY